MKLQANTKMNGRLKSAPTSLYRTLRSRPPKTVAKTADHRGRNKVKQGHLFSEAFVLACRFISRGVEWKTNLKEFLPLQNCVSSPHEIWNYRETNLKI